MAPDIARLYALADELRTIANLGLHYSPRPHDRAAFERVLRASAGLIAAVEDGSEEDVFAAMRSNPAHVSPGLGAEAVVARDGRLLLIRRADNGLWALPGGLVDVGETPAQAALRELREEAGLSGRVTRLLGMFDSRL